MEIVLGVILGVIIGAVFVKLTSRNKQEQINALTRENLELNEKYSAKEREIVSLNEDKLNLVAQTSALKSKIETQENLANELKSQITTEREYANKIIETSNERIKKEQEHAMQMREESDRQWALKFEALKKEMQAHASEALAAKQDSLQEANKAQMDELLKPIKEQFEAFRKSVEENKTQNEVNKKELQDSFEATMKLFQQHQESTIKNLKEQTERIGSDAANLTRALKSETKTQGNWGEMVLETILENSGLHKGEEYFVQENVKDDEGNNLRPDVVVRFPEGRSVVIDSKVSLTAYADAVSADNDEERERALKEHVRSIRKHVDELAEKKYDRIVNDAIGFVLMFVPNESSYIAAMKHQPDLSRYAYQKRVIIISPSNLLMALQLAYNLWQYDRQGKNVEKIVKTAADLYDKLVLFEDSFMDIDTQITRIRNSFTEARNRLYLGKGNVMSRMESLMELGVTPKKRLKGTDSAE